VILARLAAVLRSTTAPAFDVPGSFLGQEDHGVDDSPTTCTS